MGVTAWRKISRCPICGGRVKVNNIALSFDSVLSDKTVFTRCNRYYRFACAQKHYWTCNRGLYEAGLKGAIRAYNRWASNPREAREQWAWWWLLEQSDRWERRALRRVLRDA